MFIFWIYSTVIKPTPLVPALKSIKIGKSLDPISAQVSPSVIVPVDPYLNTFAAVPAANAVNTSVDAEVVPALILAASHAVVILMIISDIISFSHLIL